MAERLKVLSISHSCVVKAYRKRHVEIAKHPNIEASLLTPDSWPQFNHICVANALDDSETDLNLITKKPYFSWIPHHGLRNSCHIYSGLGPLLEAFRPDILELWEEPYFALAFQAGLAFRRVNPNGGLIFFSAQNVRKWRPPPFSLFEHWVFSNADLCFAMSEEVKVVLREKGWKGPSKVIPLGVDMDAFKEPSALSIAQKLPKPIVGYLGKMDTQKGVLDLLEAIEGLNQETKVTPLFIGNGALKDPIRERLKELSLPSLVLDAIDHERVPSALASMDVIVMPSKTQSKLKEQFGRVAIEAMAAGTPLIVSSSGALPEVVEDGALVYPEGDIEALKEALKQLLFDQGFSRNLIYKGKALVERKYSWKRIASEIVSSYKQLLTRKD